MTEPAAVILAAGSGSRYRRDDASTRSKLLAEFEGVPLVRRVALAALASRARPVIVVTGHARAEVEAALDGLAVEFVDNPRFAEGLSTSLRAGIAAVPADAPGALVLLGDMPLVTPKLIDRLIEAFAAVPECSAVVPVRAGQRGNPVVLSRRLFASVDRLSGDQGARGLLGEQPPVLEIPLEDAAIAVDIDTPAELAQLSGPSAPALPEG